MKEWQLRERARGNLGAVWPRVVEREMFHAEMIAPRLFPLIAYPKAWTPGTNGPVTAEAVLTPIQKEEDFAQYQGQLKGKFVLTAPMHTELKPHFEADAHRYTEAELADMAQASRARLRRSEAIAIAQFRAQRELNRTSSRSFCRTKERRRGSKPSPHDDGTVFVQSGGSRDPEGSAGACARRRWPANTTGAFTACSKRKFR